MSWIRSPLLHFLTAGTILFLVIEARDAREDPGAKATLRIEIDAERVRGLESEFTEQIGRPPGGAELERLIAAEVEEEILFREALTLGLLERDGGVETRLIQKMLFLEGATEIDDAGALLDRAMELELYRDDIVVRRILVQKMRLYASHLDESERPDDDDVARRYAETRDQLRTPDRISFAHIFLSADARGHKTQSDAVRIAARLESETIDATTAIELGDAFPLGHRFTSKSERDIERSFGAGLGRQSVALEPNRWSPPIESAYGWHLLWVESREAGRVPEFDAVADRIRRQLELEFEQTKLEALLSELRDRYEVVIMSPTKEIG